jgi:hypothetical protein
MQHPFHLLDKQFICFAGERLLTATIIRVADGTLPAR